MVPLHDKISKHLVTGDILLSQADSLLSLLAYHFADITHVHIATVIWATSLKPLQIVPSKCEDAKLYIWETDPVLRYDYLSGKEITGCRLVSFDDFATSTIGIKVRHIRRCYDVCQILTEQITRRQGQPFANGRSLEIIQAVYEYEYETIEKDIKNRYLYCTELAAEYLNEVMVTNNFKNVHNLHMASPCWYDKHGPFNNIFLDDEAQPIYESEISLRSRIIYFSLFLLIITTIIVFYATYNTQEEKSSPSQQK